MKVELENLWIEYPLRINGKIQPQKKTAIKDLSLKLSPGDRLGISGPNGSGKSSLLRVIAGVQPPSRGKLTVEGRVGSMLSISSGFHGKATGVENLRYRAKLMNMKLTEVNEAIEFARDEMELNEAIDQPLETYSSGMRMKLSFSLATSYTPEILVMDEWLSVGDKAFQEKAKARMNNVFDSAGIVILASHSDSTLERLGGQRLELKAEK
jgi:lipopolysaccharide transport system ATP-binding protein